MAIGDTYSLEDLETSGGIEWTPEGLERDMNHEFVRTELEKDMDAFRKGAYDDALSRDYWSDRLPFVIPRKQEQAAALQRIQEGKADSNDTWHLAMLARRKELNEGRSIFGTAGDIITHVPAFVAEMAATEGVSSGAKALATQGAKALTTGLLRELPKGLARQALKGAARAVIPTATTILGEAARTPLMPQFPKGVMELTGPQVSTGQQEDGTTGFDTQPGRPLPEAIRRAYTDTVIEMASEQSGGPIMEMLGPALKKLAPEVVTKLVNETMEAAAKRTLSPRARKAIAEFAKAAHYSGPVGEFLEERVGDAARYATGLQDNLLPSAKQLGAEAVAFSALPAGQAAIGLATVPAAQEKLKDIRTARQARDQATETILHPATIDAFAQAAPEKAAALAATEAPSRADWQAAGLPPVGGNVRAQFAQALRSSLAQQQAPAAPADQQSQNPPNAPESVPVAQDEGRPPRTDLWIDQQPSQQQPTQTAEIESSRVPGTHVSEPAQQPSLPPPAPGTVRFYHGGNGTDGKRWLSQDQAYAEGYAKKSGGTVSYVDIPEDSPLLQKSYDDTDTGQKAPYVNFEAPEEIARGLKPVSSPEIPDNSPIAPPAGDKSPSGYKDGAPDARQRIDDAQARLAEFDQAKGYEGVKEKGQRGYLKKGNRAALATRDADPERQSIVAEINQGRKDEAAAFTKAAGEKAQGDELQPSPGQRDFTEEPELASVHGFGLGGLTKPTPPDVVGTDSVAHPNARIEERLTSATGYEGPTLFEQAGAGFEAFKNLMTRSQEHLPNTEEFAVAREIFRLIPEVKTSSSDETNRTIAKITEGLGGEKQKRLFERYLAMRNLHAAMERGEPARLGFEVDDNGNAQTIAQAMPQVKAYLDQLQADVDATPAVKKAVEKRTAAVQAIVSQLVDAELLPPEAIDRAETYFHQQVLSYVDASRRKAGQTLKPYKRTFQRKRLTTIDKEGNKTEVPQGLGEDYDYNLDFIEAEAEWMNHALTALGYQKLWTKMEEAYDQKPKLEAEAKSEGVELADLLRARGDKLASYQIIPGNVFYPTYTVPERIAEAALDGAAQSVSAADVRQVLALGGPKKINIFPVELVKQLQAADKPAQESAIGRWSRQTMNVWKAFAVLNPHNAIGYQIRNASGDLDAVLGGAPGVLPYMGQAMKELWDYHGQSKLELSDSLREARNHGVIGSGLATDEIPSAKDLGLLGRFYSSTRPKWNLVAQAWETVRTFNSFREDALRYAAYLHYKSELDNQYFREGGHFGGADEATVKAVEKVLGKEAAAAHLARNLLGDYGNLTVGGQTIRQHLLPFYAYMETNFKRYVQFMRNAGEWANKQPGVLRKAAYLTVAAASMGLLTAALHLYNRLRFPDEEDELTDKQRSALHVNLGRNPDGSVRIFENVGALGEFMEWFGLNDLLSAIPKVQRGEQTIGETATEMAKAPINKVARSLRPDIQLLREATGYSSFPDAFEPRRIDFDDALAEKLFVGEEWKDLKGRWNQTGQRARPSKVLVYDPRTWGNPAMFGTKDVQAGEAALNAIYDAVDTFHERKGIDKEPQATSRFKFMREAVKSDDFETFKEARRYFMKNGGSAKKYADYLKRIDPVTRLGDRNGEEAEFLKTLSPEQREKLKLARVYIGAIRVRMSEWWVKASDEPAASD